MDGFLPFRPQGDSFVIPAQPATAPGGTLNSSGPTEGDVQYLIYNPSTFDAWIGFGMSSTAAVNNATAPIIGSTTKAIPSPGGSFQVVSLGPQMFFAGTAQLGSCSIYCTPGFGC